MPTTPAQIEAQIRNHRLFEFPVTWSDELLFPYYDGLALSNISQSIVAALGVPFEDSKPLLADVWQAETPQAKRVVVFLLDGVGYQHLNMLMAKDEELRDAVLELNQGRAVMPLTSVAPSTTVVALTSLWTGLPPASTGMTGTLMFLRDLSLLGNMLSFTPVVGRHPSDVIANWGLPPEDIVTAQGLSEYLQLHDIPSYAVTNRAYVGSGLSRILHRGVDNIVTHIAMSDFMGEVASVLKATQGKRSYVSIYWSGVDALAHRYGAHHPYTNDEIREKIFALRDLVRQDLLADGETLFMFFADHGHYDATQAIDLGDDALIADAMQMSLSGDERHAYLYAKHGTVDAIKDHIKSHYADKLTVIESKQALELGYFGDTPSKHFIDRIGDLILIPRLGYTVADPKMGAIPMISRHAGLSDWEMLIPFIWQLS